VNVGEVVVVLVVGLVAGALNSVAGGGTMVTYPTLVFVGLDPITANATSTLALWPGYVAATAGFRRELVGTKRLLLELALPSLAGGILGAVLLLLTPNHTFELLAPFLILAAAVLLLLQDRKPPPAHPERIPSATAGLVVWQFFAAVYGGYFGAGLGFVLLVGYGLFGNRDFLQSSGLKNATTVLINGIALAYFIAKGTIVWADGLAMAIGATAGGYSGASIARRLGARRVRRFVVALGFLLAVALLVKALV
jgi:uncharacterized membrane protein YfcA